MKQDTPFSKNKLGTIPSIRQLLNNKLATLINKGIDKQTDIIYQRRLRLTNFISLNSVLWLSIFTVVLCITHIFVAAGICFLFSLGNLVAYSFSIKRKTIVAYYLMSLSNLGCSVFLFVCYGHFSGAYFLIILWLISVVFLSDNPRAYIPMFLLGVFLYIGLEFYFIHSTPLLTNIEHIHQIYIVALIACFIYLISLFEFLKKTYRYYQTSLEEKNEQLLAYYKAIEQTYATIVITDVNGNIEYVNPQFEATSGYTAQETIGKNPRILKSNKKSTEEYKELWDTITQGKVWRGEFLNLTKDQTEFIERAIISPIINDDGEIIRYIAIKENITELKKTEQALKESQQNYKLLAENSADVIWKIDIATFQYNYISPSVFTLRGYTVEEAMKQTVEESLTPESYTKAIGIVNSYLQQAEIPNLNIREQFQQPCKDGTIIDIELSATFIRDENGNPAEILGITRDISKRKQAERALKKSEAKLALLLEKQTQKNQRLSSQLEYIYNNTVNAVAFFDIVGENIIFSSCNKLWANSIGYNTSELEGFDISLFNDKETEALYRNFITKAIKTRASIQDSVFWHDMCLHVIVIPIIDEYTGDISTCASFVYNITETYQAKLLIKETEEKFQTIFNNSTDAIVVFTPDMNLLEVNEYYYHLTGFNITKGQMSLATFSKYVPAKYHNELFIRINQLVEGNKITSFECELYKADGSLISVELNSSLFKYNGAPAVLCMIRDVSFRKSMERKLTHIGVQTETRERRRLAADLHDNVGPLLSSMNMYLSALFINPEIKKHSEAFNDVRRILKDSIAAVREISNNISPHVLTNYGLSAALQSFFETKKNLIKIIISDELNDLRFSETKEIMVYNIFKEAFNNTLKYANASTVIIQLVPHETSIHVSYTDDGIGFVLEEKLATASLSLGLFSMINRIKILDGTYQINTAPNKGFAIDIWFPMENM